MRSFPYLFVLAACLFQSSICPAQAPAEQAGQHIVLDGEFNDWSDISPALVDPADAPNSPVDFGEVRIASDARFVYFMVDFGRTVNVQGLDGTAMILLDVDGDRATGQTQFNMDGVDVIVDLSPPKAPLPATPDAPVAAKPGLSPGLGIGIRSITFQPPLDPATGKPQQLNIYDVGFMHEPTFASRRFEFRLDRGAMLPQTPPLFKADHFAMKLAFIDQNAALADQTDAMEYKLSAAAALAPPQDERDPLAKVNDSSLRIMSWNVERGAILKRSEPFARTIAAINPDIILLQELTEKTTPDQVREFLAKALPADASSHWNVEIGAGGGDLRCGIATRLDLQPVEGLRIIPLADQPGRSVRATAAAVVDQHQKRLLVVSVHLRCCGRADGPEDRARIAEVRALSEAISDYLRAQAVDGVVLAGDFNLVGSRDPLEILAAGLDLDHSALHIAQPYQLDGLSNTTWADRGQPFAPGRLDFMLYSDSRLETAGSFVYDASDLSPHWLEVHHAQAADTSQASDHLPVVVDFDWVANQQR